MRSYLGRSAAKWLGCGALAISAVACASDKTPAKEPVAMGEMTAPGPQQPRGRRESDTTIAISEEFRRECQLPNAPKEAPHFDYADATLHARGANILDDVAKCLSAGPLKGRVITIIGRTDARGSAEYNKELSANRAEAARNYLVQRGVDTQRLAAVGRGEASPIADNESAEGRATNRRVEIVVSGAEKKNETGTSQSDTTKVPTAATPTAPASASAGSSRS